jgi:hypothetical protein
VFFATFHPPDSSFQGPLEQNHFLERRRQVVDRRAPHMFLVGEQLEVLELAIGVIAILPPDSVARRDRSVRRFPYTPMHELPGLVVRSLSARFLRNLDPQIAVGIRLYRSDRQIVPWTPGLF